MKTVVFFMCIIGIVLGHGLSPHERQFLKQVHDSCQSNPRTYCDEDKLRNLVNNINDYQVGVHMSCMAIKAGLQFPQGELNVPNMKNKISLVVEPRKIDDIIRICAKTAETPGKTANLMWVCFVQNNVEYYHKL